MRVSTCSLLCALAVLAGVRATDLCLCIDNVSQFLAKVAGHSEFTDAVAERLQRDDPGTRNIFRRTWENLGGSEWSLSDTLVSKTSQICQEFYQSLADGNGGQTSCGLPKIQFAWDADSVQTASYCDMYGITCCSEQGLTSAFLFEEGKHSLDGGRPTVPGTMRSTYDSHSSFRFHPSQDIDPRELLVQASGNRIAMAGKSCEPHLEHQVLDVDLRGMGLRGNMSDADSAFFVTNLPHVQHVLLANNPALFGMIPVNYSPSLQYVDIVSTGLEVWPWSQLLTKDELVRYRTAVTGIMSTVASGHTDGLTMNITLDTALPTLIQTEYGYLKDLYSKSDHRNDSQEDYTLPDYPGIVGGVLALSLNLAEVTPAWQDECVDLIPYSQYLVEMDGVGDNPLIQSAHDDPLNETIICETPVMKNVCSGDSPTYTVIQAHPIYHAYHPDFCSCAKLNRRIAFFTNPKDTWRRDMLPLSHPDANATSVIAMCVPGVGNELFQDWVFLPMGIYLLVNVLVILAKRSTTLEDWMRQRYHPHAGLKRKQQPGDIKFGAGNRAEVKGSSDSWTEVTLVMTDVEGSTAIWEWSSEIMNAALSLHDDCIRQHIDLHFGLEVMTEGDAFIIAFHQAHNAVTWCLHVQEELLRVQWPARLDEHPQARTVTVANVLDMCSELPRLAYAHDMIQDAKCIDKYQSERQIFKGLRVRMAVHTDMPDACEVHDVTGSRSYKGSISRFTKMLTDVATGGQVILSAASFGRMRSEKNMFMAHQALESALAASRRRAASRETAALSPTSRLIRQLLALKEALGWRESIHAGSTILLMDMGLMPPSDKTPIPQSLYVDNVSNPDEAAVIRLPVQYGSTPTVYQAITKDLHTRALYFDAAYDPDIDSRTGFFSAPGALEYMLGCPLPFVCSMHVLGKWDSSISVTSVHKRFFHDMVVQLATAYRGYVSICDWDAAVPSAHVLFMLPEEAIAAAVTMHLVAGELKKNSTAKSMLSITDIALPSGMRRSLPFLLRIGISCDVCNMHFPTAATGRLVIQGPVNRQGKTTVNLASWHQLLVDLQSLQAAFHSPQLQEEERLGVLNLGKRRRRQLGADPLLARPHPSGLSRHNAQAMLLDPFISSRTRTADSISSTESKRSSSFDGTSGHRSMDHVPTEQHVLHAKFLGRFFMQSSKKACQLASVYEANDRSSSKSDLSRSAQHTQISKPSVTEPFDLADMKLLSPAGALRVLLNNMCVEEHLSEAYADRKRTNHTIW